jgi:Na+/H+ antiporter NhaC
MEWLSVLPPLVAIVVVLWRREVILALFLAIFVSELLLTQAFANGLLIALLNSLERIAAVFADIGNTRILMFSLMIGALMAYMRHSGGVTALVERLVQRGLAGTPRRASLLTSGVGAAIFVEGNLSILTSGIMARGLFDKFGMSRARLAYIIDSTAAPVCILILLNGWGAYVLALLGGYELGAPAAVVLWGTVPLNFYALFALALVFFTAWTGRTFGPMSRREDEVETEYEADIEYPPTRARYMLVPMATLVLGMIGFMLWTGNGSIAAGSGSKSVLYATALACVVAYLMMLGSRRFDHLRLVKIGFDGMGELLPLVTIVLFSLALGASLKELGTGVFIAGLVGDFLPMILVAPMLFLAGALISFSTGTSWGTFAILIPLGMPLVEMLGLPPTLVLAAILGGGVFGDHCSPISDTTAISSLAAGCDLLEHVKTQLPYALVAGAAALVAYFLAGLFLL